MFYNIFLFVFISYYFFYNLLFYYDHTENINDNWYEELKSKQINTITIIPKC